MSIAASLIEAIQTEAKRYPKSHVQRAGVRIGELAGIDPEALLFCFEVLARDTELANMELAIHLCPRRHHCTACDESFDVKNYELQCPRCGESRTEYVSGDELELAYLEVEDYATSSVAAQST